MKLHSKKIFCVGNAHLDPVWMWRWQEGSSEAKATIRSALDRMKEYPDFKFVCAGAQIFQWIEQFDPRMFEEIRQRVDEGRFVIAGGWFVQPDCNLPSGESFVRHALYSQRYFREKFGCIAKVGYSVDAFGHNGNLPQLLKKSGMDQYVFMRPRAYELELPAPTFRWRAADGSEILASRMPCEYNSSQQLNEADTFEKLLADMEAEVNATSYKMLLFYGVGNHGGGPTKRNIEMIQSFHAQHPETEFIFSDLMDFFNEMRTQYHRLPIIDTDLQYHAVGCYSAISRIKQLNRRAECELLAAETYGMVARHLLGRGYPEPSTLAYAWQNVMFNQFHDTIGGSCLPKAYEDSDSQLGESRSLAAKIENTALQSISWQINIPDLEKGIPLVLFNPHPFDVRQMVCFEKRQDHVCDDQGNELPMQHTHTEMAHIRHIPNNSEFIAHVPAMGYATYFLRRDVGNPSREKAGPFHAWDKEPRDYMIPDNAPSATDLVLENEFLRVEFERHTGYIRSIRDVKTGREMAGGMSAVPVVIDEFYHDTWSHRKNSFDQVIGQFTDAEIQVTENGPLRATIRVTSRYNDSRLTQYFSLIQGERQLRARVKLDWHEKKKMLKFRFRTELENPTAYYEIPYSVHSRPTDGNEEACQMWFATKDQNRGYALLNDGKYAASCRGKDMEMTVIRSPYYLDMLGRGLHNDPESEYTDQGRNEFSYIFMPFEGDSWSEVIRSAKLLNTPLTMVRETLHSGPLSTNYRGMTVSAPNVMVTVLKRSEDNTGTILRAYETDGTDTQVQISGDLLPVALNERFTPHSINTYYLADGSSSWQPVMMTEFPIQ